MLTNRQDALYNLLLSIEDGVFTSTKDIVYSLPCYRGITNYKTACSAVQADVLALREKYASGELHRCVVGRNAVGYKIGTLREIVESSMTLIHRHAKGIRREKEIMKAAGIDGQLAFKDDGIVVMDVARKEEEK